MATFPPHVLREIDALIEGIPAPQPVRSRPEEMSDDRRMQYYIAVETHRTNVLLAALLMSFDRMQAGGPGANAPVGPPWAQPGAD
jgi:hypothetical protein